jgi:hypothetical protein
VRDGGFLQITASNGRVIWQVPQAWPKPMACIDARAWMVICMYEPPPLVASQACLVLYKSQEEMRT